MTVYDNIDTQVQKLTEELEELKTYVRDHVEKTGEKVNKLQSDLETLRGEEE